jgi:alpha 1,3-glucosidase
VNVQDEAGRPVVFIRGGTFVPFKRRVRKAARLTFWDPFTLIVALDDSGGGEGELYADDGETFNFARDGFVHQKLSFKRNKLSGVVVGVMGSDFVARFGVVIEQIKIAGMNEPPKAIIDHNGRELSFVWKEGIVTVHGPKFR